MTSADTSTILNSAAGAAASAQSPQWRGVGAPVSVIILTLNEEVNIRACIESCAWSDDVHVLDSGSTDATCELARSLGAGVHHHAFESFGAQRNWAIENIPTKHEWIFHLDADERFTPELVQEIIETLAANPTEAGFHVPSKLMFLGTWLKRSGGYPAYQMRLFHKTRMRFCDHGHGQRESTDGEIGRLVFPYLHYNFSKGLDDWFEKHNRYSRLEAQQSLRVSTGSIGSSIRSLFTRDRVGRRRALKSIGYGLPCRPLLVAFYMLVIKRGIFDGPAGWKYVNLRSTYERMIDLKIAEERRRSLDEGLL